MTLGTQWQASMEGLSWSIGRPPVCRHLAMGTCMLLHLESKHMMGQHTWGPREETSFRPYRGIIGMRSQVGDMEGGWRVVCVWLEEM